MDDETSGAVAIGKLGVQVGTLTEEHRGFRAALHDLRDTAVHAREHTKLVDRVTTIETRLARFSGALWVLVAVFGVVAPVVTAFLTRWLVRP